MVHEMRRREELSPNAREEMELLSRSVDWGNDLADQGYTWDRPEWLFLTWEGDRLVSRVGLLERTVRAAGEPVRVGGIGGVSTLPEFEGRGLASGNMRRAAAFMREELGVEFGMLFCLTDRIPFYRRLGWEVITAALEFVRPEGAGCPFHAMVLTLGDSPWPEGPIDLCGLPW